MGNIFKALIITAPALVLLFYYVVLQHQKIDVEIEKENLKFEREWNEFKAESL